MMIDKKTGLLDIARKMPSPNHDDRPDENDISLIVIHNITLPPGEFGGPWIDALFTNCLPEKEHPFFAEINHLRVSSHLLIRRDGEIVQYVPFHKRAFHAGVSQFRGRKACNDFSIGIEMEGTDDTPFTDKQYDQLKEIIDSMLDAYPTLSASRITGHEHIAPGRKTDPGQYFAWDKLASYYGEKLPTTCQ
jgi:AmpD protein